MSVVPYALPFRTPIRTARVRMADRRGLLVRVRAGALEGLGDAAPWPGFGLEPLVACEAALHRACRELRGARLDGVGDTEAWLEGLARVAPAAAGALRTALEDLAAKGRGIPLAAHLGGRPAGDVPVAALLGEGPAAALAAEAEARCREGFRTLKVKLTGRVELDRRRLEAVRRAAPPPVALRIDAGRGFGAAEAEAGLAGLARHAPEFVEEPLADPEPRAIARLLCTCPVPVAFDESLADRELRESVLEHGAGHFAVIKPAALGGPRRALALARDAREHGLRVVVTSFLDSAVGVAAALHLAAAVGCGEPAAGLATSRLFLRDVAVPPPIEGGRAAVPAQPGLGIELAPAATPNGARVRTGTPAERLA